MKRKREAGRPADGRRRVVGHSKKKEEMEYEGEQEEEEEEEW